jgi:hypothetical protein
MNSTNKMKTYVSYSQQTYASIIVTILTPQVVSHHHAGKFLPNQKVFFRMTSPCKLQSWGRVLQAMVMVGSTSQLNVTRLYARS